MHSLVGLAASFGAGISMGLAEALSDDGLVRGRGNPVARGGITGAATAFGGMLHTFPFLLPNLPTALTLAYLVVVLELLGIAFIRYRYMHIPLGKTIAQVIVGGAIVFGVGVWLGSLGVSTRCCAGMRRRATDFLVRMTECAFDKDRPEMDQLLPVFIDAGDHSCRVYVDRRACQVHILPADACLISEQVI